MKHARSQNLNQRKITCFILKINIKRNYTFMTFIPLVIDGMLKQQMFKLKLHYRITRKKPKKKMK